MTISLHQLLPMAYDHLPDEIINPDLTTAIKRVAPVFSSCCSSYYLEWHHKLSFRSDFLCSLTFNNRHHLVQPSSRTGETPGYYDGWDTLYHFINSWEIIQKRFRGRIPHVWLAFDHTERGTLDPPNIHYCIDKRFADRRRRPYSINRLSLAEFNRILNLLTEQHYPAVTPYLHSAIQRSFNALLQNDGEVIHLSFMENRLPPVIKLNMTIPTSRLKALLEAVDWQGDIVSTVTYGNQYTQNEPRTKGNICLTEDGTGRFELELEYNTPLVTDPRRITMLNTMLHHNLLSPVQTQQLHAWPGREETVFRRKSYVVERWLDIKLCFSTDGTVSVKPYFGFAPVPRVGWKRESHVQESGRND